MLVVKNLNKTYQSKSGVSHDALKNISLELGQKGFVFILGKSGSGKSTLLNVLGGLDQFDSGDIVIKNKSSKDFKAKDWDSYRNTYLGFVFQEFNIIETYSVAKNVALALELQGIKKHAIKDEVSKILDQVELKDYGKRRPNELSGGQKQRVAIARALVKNPEIILADEPTGNLDKATGEQILGILRKLAEDKLVIMVSHDKDSAYKYADRIITMSDGKIESDEYNEGGLKYISEDVDRYRTHGEINSVLRIPKGKSLDPIHVDLLNEAMMSDDRVLYIPVQKNKKFTTQDIEMLNKLIEDQNDDVYMPIVDNITEIQGTNDVKMKSRTNPAKDSIEKFVSSFKLIKSKLPFGDSFKMALSAIWRKRLKLIFSSLLFVVALAMFGFSETVTRFDFTKAISNSYTVGEIEIVSLLKSENVMGWDKSERTSVPFKMSDVTAMISEHQQIEISKLYSFTGNGIVISNETKLVKPKTLKGFLEIDSMDALGANLLIGNFSETTNEIMITDFVADYYIAEKEQYTSYDDILNTPFEIDYKKYSVTAIVDTDYEQYLGMNDVSQSQLKEMVGEVGAFSGKHDSLYSRIIVNSGFYENYSKDIKAYQGYHSFQIPALDAQHEWETWGVAESISYFDNDILNHPNRDDFLFVPENFRGLKDNEILVSPNTLSQLNYFEDQEVITQLVYNKSGESEDNIYQKLLNEGYFPKEDIDMSIVGGDNWVRLDQREFKVVGVFDFDRYNQIMSVQMMYDYLMESGHTFSTEDMAQFDNNFGHFSYKVSVDYMKLKLEELDIPVMSDNEFWNTENNNGDYWGYIHNIASKSDIRTLQYVEQVWSPLITTKKVFDDLNPFTPENVHGVLVKLSDTPEINEDFFDMVYKKGYRHDTLSGRILGMFSDFVEDAAHIFRYVSFGLAGFSVLLMFLNISASVMSAKREIGTLRAIGARGNDVATIFVTEAIIIDVLASIVSNIALLIITKILNANLTEQLGMPLTIFNGSPVIAAEIVALAVAVVIAAAFLPVKGVSIMKPIDAIKNI